MLKDSDIARTVRGIIPTFADIFTGARYARELYRDHRRGQANDIRPGELCVLVDFNARGLGLPDTFGDSQLKSILAATPCDDFMKPRFSPRIASRGTRQSVPPSGIRIIAWRPAGHFLILAGDPNNIRDEWWGFVPFGQSFTVEGA